MAFQDTDFDGSSSALSPVQRARKTVSGAGIAAMPGQGVTTQALSISQPPQQNQNQGISALPGNNPNAGTGSSAAGQARANADGGITQPDGSIAFSNIPGKPGALSQKQIADLENRNVVSGNNMQNPGVGTATSAVSDSTATPSSAQGASIAQLPPGYKPQGADQLNANNQAVYGSIASRNDPTTYGSIASRYAPTSGQDAGIAALPNFNNAVNDARSDNRQSQRDAMSDMASIAGGDWRTPSGTAARNAAIDLKSNLESIGRYAHDRTSRAALADAYTKQYQNTVGGMPASVLDGLRGDSSINQDALRGIASLGTNSLNNDARVDVAGTNAGAKVDAATVNANAKVGAATVNANRPRTSGAIDHGAMQAYQDAYNDQDNAKLPNAQRIAAAQAARDAVYAKSQSQQTSSGAQPANRYSPGAKSGVPSVAASFLKQNPHYADQFDAKYGKGAAAGILGNQ